MPDTSPAGYVALVPVKPPRHGKSRLAEVGHDERLALALAFARDTVAACLDAARVTRVLVATDDAALAGEMTALGAWALPDGEAGDLNGSLRQAALEAERRWPGLRPVVVCADLPALRPADLDALLARCDELTGPAYVPDADGVGTTAYVGGRGGAAPPDFEPAYGAGSRARHAASGAVELLDVAPGLRLDVDDLAALREAAAAGLGPHTEVTARALGLLGDAG